MRYHTLVLAGMVFALSLGSCTNQKVGTNEQILQLRARLLQQSAALSTPEPLLACDSVAARLEILAADRTPDDVDPPSWVVNDGPSPGQLMPTFLAASEVPAEENGRSGDAVKPLETSESTQPEKPATAERWWQKPIGDRSLFQVIKDDGKQFPNEFWKSTKDSINVPSLAILGGALALSETSRTNWDHRVDHSFQYKHSQSSNIFSKEGDFGSVIGNPFLHFGVAMAGYGLGVQTKNDKLYGFSKSLMQALILTDATTGGLKLAVNNTGPNREKWAWPSGHTSSTAAVAGVLWEYYGWQAGVPAYLLTGWVATSRLQDREHWLSDVIFGAALGAVIGHSVAHGRMLEVGGFTVLPYADAEGGGVLLMKEF